MSQRFGWTFNLHSGESEKIIRKRHVTYSVPNSNQPCGNFAASFEQYQAIDPVYGWKRNKLANIFSGRYCLSSR